MGSAEIIAALPTLSAEERSQIQAKLDELAANAWQDRGELSDAEKSALDASINAYEQSPDAGSAWDDVKARVQSKFK